jgi:hypothetical protein
MHSGCGDSILDSIEGIVAIRGASVVRNEYHITPIRHSLSPQVGVITIAGHTFSPNDEVSRPPVALQATCAHAGLADLKNNRFELFTENFPDEVQSLWNSARKCMLDIQLDLTAPLQLSLLQDTLKALRVSEFKDNEMLDSIHRAACKACLLLCASRELMEGAQKLFRDGAFGEILSVTGAEESSSFDTGAAHDNTASAQLRCLSGLIKYVVSKLPMRYHVLFGGAPSSLVLQLVWTQICEGALSNKALRGALSQVGCLGRCEDAASTAMQSDVGVLTLFCCNALLAIALFPHLAAAAGVADGWK